MKKEIKVEMEHSLIGSIEDPGEASTGAEVVHGSLRSGHLIDEASGSDGGNIRGGGGEGGLEADAEIAASTAIARGEDDGDSASTQLLELGREALFVRLRGLTLALVTVGDAVDPRSIGLVAQESDPGSEVSPEIVRWVAVEPGLNLGSNAHDVLNVEGGLNAGVGGSVVTNDLVDGLLGSVVHVLREELSKI
jgi:hypothetical protein